MVTAERHPSSPPRLDRAVFAAAAASAAVPVVPAAVATAIVDGDLWELVHFAFLFPFVFLVALSHAVLLGLPIYALFPPRWRASVWTILGASFLIGAIPMPLLLLLPSGNVEGLSAWSDGVPTIIDGHRTAFYYRQAMETAAQLGVFGMAGGFAFWLVIRKDKIVRRAD